jgi:hypothetical protein
MYNIENLIRIGVMMPDKLSLDLDKLKVIVVHLGNDARMMRGDQRSLNTDSFWLRFIDLISI